VAAPVGLNYRKVLCRPKNEVLRIEVAPEKLLLLIDWVLSDVSSFRCSSGSVVLLEEVEVLLTASVGVACAWAGVWRVVAFLAVASNQVLDLLVLRECPLEDDQRCSTVAAELGEGKKVLPHSLDTHVPSAYQSQP